MDTQTRYTAAYSYPGAFFPETTTRELPEPTLRAAIVAGPDEDGYFRKNGWYAVEIRTTTSKRFTSTDGDEAWVQQSSERVGQWVVGDRVHWSDIEDTPSHSILRSNIRDNSKDGFGVRTRCGNWQIASDFDDVLSPAAVG